MGKNKSLFVGVSLVLILGFVGIYLYGNNDTTYADDESTQVEEVETEREKQTDKTIKDEHDSETKDKAEKSINKEKSNAIEEDTTKDIKIDDLSQYKIEKLTEEEIHQILYSFEYNVNTKIIFAHQEGINSESYDENHRHRIDTFGIEFEWIKENYDFGTDRHNELIEVILDSIEKHKAGDNEALLTLKEAVYELNLDINPHLDEEITAADVTVEDTKKVINGETPGFVP